VEAKEGLEIQNESVTLASVSYQAFFRGFPKLAGARLHHCSHAACKGTLSCLHLSF